MNGHNHRPGSLATMGYGAQSPDWSWELPAVMRFNSQAVIVDTRQSPRCDWSATWQRPTLEQTWGKRYIWKGDLLGNLNYRNPGLPIQLANEVAGVSWVIQCLQQGWTLILLCGCPTYDRCHRKVIYDRVKARVGDQLPEYEPGQRVMTLDGPGTVDPGVPLEVHRARNRYAVKLDHWSPRRAFFPHELQPYDFTQQRLIS
jgi:hypothetical protein